MSNDDFLAYFITVLLSKKNKQTMATISAVIVPTKALRDGRHKVRIAIAHNGETRYILTNIVIDSAKEFRHGQIYGRPDASIQNIKLRKILNDYQDIIDELQYAEGMTCSELISVIKGYKSRKNRSIESIFKEYLEQSTAGESSKQNYTCVWNVISGLIDISLPINMITPISIKKMAADLSKRKLRGSTLRVYMMLMRAIINYASKCGYAQFPTDPFLLIKLPQTAVRQSWLTVDEIKMIRDAECKKASIRKARDLFMLSYYLGGMNIVDLLQISFTPGMRKIHYIRQKVKSRSSESDYVEFLIPKEAREIIDRVIGADGKIIGTPGQIRSRFQSLFRTALPRLAQQLGLNEIIYYSARKSFSQHAFNLGISTTVIDYLIGHKVKKSGSCLYHYITVSPEMASAALRKVLDNLI